jgi:hypothetical protein
MGVFSYFKIFTAWVLLKGALTSIPAIGAGTAAAMAVVASALIANQLNLSCFMLGNTMKHFENKGPIVQSKRSLIQGTVQSSSVTLLAITSQLYKSSIDQCRTV